MSNNLSSILRSMLIDMLDVYERAEATISFEADCRRASEEIGEQTARLYQDVVKMNPRQPFVDEIRTEVQMIVMDASKIAHDPWAACRDANRRVKLAYDIIRIIERKAGDRHKFSIWSGINYGTKTKYGKGVRVLVAAPSAKKAVEWINELLGGRENLSGFRDHWTGGGFVGEKVATKMGIWVSTKKEHHNHEVSDFKLIWEPKL